MPILAATKLETIRQMARAYQVTPRTVYRWQRAGVEISDPCSVALHLAKQKSPAPAAVAAVKNILKNELESLT
jgi:hypothetical protein